MCEYRIRGVTLTISVSQMESFLLTAAVCALLKRMYSNGQVFIKYILFAIQEAMIFVVEKFSIFTKKPIFLSFKLDTKLD